MNGTVGAGWRQVPRSVIVLGFVSLFMDTSSELVHSLLPLFLVGTLGASAVTLGAIEGIAGATASIAKVFSGVLSDYVTRRKLFVVLGYGMSAAVKPVFPLAGSAAAVLGARFLDRIGKGIRGAPRDALLADITPPAVRGVAFGIRQSLDTVGACVGPPAAIVLMAWYADDFRKVFWWAVLPAMTAVALLAFGVKEPAVSSTVARREWPVRRAAVGRLEQAYWNVVFLGIVFTLSQFSEAFLLLQRQRAGLTLALVPLVMVVMNLVYAAIAAPAGALSDRVGRFRLLIGGLLAEIAADLILGFVPGLAGLFVGVALWGAYLGLTQGLFAALIADTAPAELRGTAYGVYNLVTGVALLAASLLAGELWDHFGPTATFATGAGFAAITAVMVARRRSAAGINRPSTARDDR